MPQLAVKCKFPLNPFSLFRGNSKNIPMTTKPLMTRNALFWLAMAFLAGGLLWLLSDALLPFMVGIAIAYLLAPLCDRLEKRGVNRTLAAFLVLALFILLAMSFILLIAPIVGAQVRQLAIAMPDYIEALRAYAEPRLQELLTRLTPEQSQKIRDAVQSYGGDIAGALLSVLERLWQGSRALFGFFSVLFITPIVAFYLLRDWNELVCRVDNWLPRASAETIRAQVKAIDRTLAGFARGQATVCFLLGTYYSVALTLVGVNYGFIIGLVAGLLSFIPFVGSTLGLVTATLLALFQFDSYTPVLIVLGIFLFAQFMEGNFITPKFVGESVGLHPVWIMFALMAGGSLLGFTGLLLAVPVAAVIGVLTRFGLSHYMQSAYYRAGPRSHHRRVRPL